MKVKTKDEDLIIWALFDSETNTIAKTFPNIKVFSFGLGSGKEHISLDLSDFEKAREFLETYPKPHIIFASPPCETWIRVNIGNISRYGKKGGLNFYWESKWKPYDFNQINKERRLNGVNTAITTARLIQHFKPQFWAIENGSSSLIFDYIENHTGLVGYKCKCNYFSYRFNILKPTIIYSSVPLQLKNNKPDRELDVVVCGGGGNIMQSCVPLGENLYEVLALVVISQKNTQRFQKFHQIYTYIFWSSLKLVVCQRFLILWQGVLLKMMEGKNEQ